MLSKEECEIALENAVDTGIIKKGLERLKPINRRTF